MGERKWHPVNASATFKPGFFRFERGEALVMIAASGIGMLLFLILTRGLGCEVICGLTLASVPPAGVITFLLCLVTGKPRNHWKDALSWAWMCLRVRLANHGVPIKCKPLIVIDENERKLS